MKQPFSLFALIALSAASLSAAPMYTIHLSNSERFTECTVIYKSDTSTKFRGKNRSGKVVTKEIPSSSIMSMREIAVSAPTTETQPTDARTEKETEQQPTAQDKINESTPPKDDQTEASDSNEQEVIAPPSAPQVDFEDANLKKQEGEDMAKDVTLRLREKLQQIDRELAGIENPSRTLLSICNNTKARVNSQLGAMDKLSLDVAEMQVKFNAAGVADYQFSVSSEERERFLHDATAAYNAMVVDMKEKKSRRKVGGLDKFEILYERYQGLNAR